MKDPTFVSAVPEEEKKKEGWNSMWRNNDWKHSKFGKSHNVQIQETEQTINRLNSKKSTQRHIVIKVMKTKDEKKMSWKQPEKNDSLPLDNLSNFSSATIGARRKGYSIFQVLNKNNCPLWNYGETLAQE